MAEGADAGREDFGGDDEGGGVRAEVEEELFGGCQKLWNGSLKKKQEKGGGKERKASGYLSNGETDKLSACA